MPGRLRPVDEDPNAILETLPTFIAEIFNEVQCNISNHQKNAVALAKQLANVSELVKTREDGSRKLRGEIHFRGAFYRVLGEALKCKKGVMQADRVMKFVATFIKTIQNRQDDETEEEEDDDDVRDMDTSATRFTGELLNWLLIGLKAGDKNVRYRCCQLFAEMGGNMGQLKRQIWEDLRKALLDRTYDKDNFVRAQACVAIAKLGSIEIECDSRREDDLMERVLKAVVWDERPEVRKAIIPHLPLCHSAAVSPSILDTLLTRTRDLKEEVCKQAYQTLAFNSKKSVEHFSDDGETVEERQYVGYAHPKRLTASQIVDLLLNGFKSRETLVVPEAEKLAGAWFDASLLQEEPDETDVRIERMKAEVKEEIITVKSEHPASPLSAIVTLLGWLDFNKEDTLKEREAAELLTTAIFKQRENIFEPLDFATVVSFFDWNPKSEFLWDDPRPLDILALRVYLEYCSKKIKLSPQERRNLALQQQIDMLLPAVTVIVSTMEQMYKLLFLDEDLALYRVLCMKETLAIALTLDYSDEVGRREMLRLVRSMIFDKTFGLAETLLPAAMDLLKLLVCKVTNERDLIRVVVEGICELRDEDENCPSNETSDISAFSQNFDAAPRYGTTKAWTPEEENTKNLVDIWCLDIFVCTLERVNCSIAQNSSLDGIIRTLVFPAASLQVTEDTKESDCIIRKKEKGMLALAQCSLISRDLATRSFAYFLSRLRDHKKPTPQTRLFLLKTLIDMLLTYPNETFNGITSMGQELDHLMEDLSKSTDADEQALLCMGLSKLAITDRIRDEEKLTEVLECLLICYFSPTTSNNEILRQCLSAFFLYYGGRSTYGRRQLRRVFLPVFNRLSGLRREPTQDDEDEVISAKRVAGMMFDWTLPPEQGALASTAGKMKEEDDIHFDMAIDIVKALLKPGEDVAGKKMNYDKNDKKALIGFVTKIRLLDSIDDDKLRTLKMLIHLLPTRNPLPDAHSIACLAKFDKELTKTYDKQLRDFNEAEARKLESLRALFEFLDDIIPLSIEEEEDVKLGIKSEPGLETWLSPARRQVRKRSPSIITISSDSGDGRSIIKEKGKEVTRKRRHNKKRRETATTDSDSGDVTTSDREDSMTSSLLIRQRINRKQTVKSQPEVIVISSDEEPAPLAKIGTTSQAKPPQALIKTLKREDFDEDELFTATTSRTSRDSIMDSDSDGERGSRRQSNISTVSTRDSIMDSDDEDEVEGLLEDNSD